MSYRQQVACGRRVPLPKSMQWRLRNHKQSTLSLLRLYASSSKNCGSYGNSSVIACPANACFGFFGSTMLVPKAVSKMINIIAIITKGFTGAKIVSTKKANMESFVFIYSPLSAFSSLYIARS